MYLDNIFCGLFLLEIQIGMVYGFDDSCDVNTTLLVPLGNNATFEAKNVHLSLIDRIQFSSKSKYIFLTHIDFFDFRGDSTYFHPEMENRTTVDIEKIGAPDVVTFIITIANLSLKDNGTYILRTRHQTYCWILFIMDIRITPSGPIMENSAARAYGNPHESLIRPLVKTTLLWLVDGLTFNKSSELLDFDGVLWIRNVGRYLHRRNVTYRAIQDNGKIDEVNITLDVTYGPSSAFPLSFTPEDTYYILKSGDTFPDISCHASCNPPCEVAWEDHSPNDTLRLGRVSASAAGKYTCVAKSSLPSVSKSLYLFVVDERTMVLSPPTTAYFLSAGYSVPDINCSALCFPPCITTWNRGSTGNILRLGAVTAEMSGEYVCTASRNDTSRQMEKSVMIFVTDDRSTTATLVVIGSIQACTTVVLGICSLLYYQRKRGMSCSDCVHHHRETLSKSLERQEKQSQHVDKKRKERKRNEVTANKPKGDDTELERYEEIDLGRTKLHLYDQAVPEQKKKKEKKKLEVYENTVVA